MAVIKVITDDGLEIAMWNELDISEYGKFPESFMQDILAACDEADEYEEKHPNPVP